MNESISSSQLHAFQAVALHKHFSRAAKTIGLTQSALTVRIQSLEERIGVTLFIRGRGGVSITPAGEALLSYCRQKNELEAEAIKAVRGDQDAGGLTGVLRIGGFSSVMRSTLLPAIAPLLTDHPGVKFKLATQEMRHLPDLFRRGEVDFLFLDRPLEDEAVESIKVGLEQYVLARKKGIKATDLPFLDHDENDETTYRFLERRTGTKVEAIRRCFTDDIYGVIDGIRLGLGKAVVPLHLMRQETDFVFERGMLPVAMPVYLNFNRQTYPSKLRQAFLKNCVPRIKKILA